MIPITRIPADTPEPLRTLLTVPCGLPEWRDACQRADLATLQAALVALSGWLTAGRVRKVLQARVAELTPKVVPRPPVETTGASPATSTPARPTVVTPPPAATPKPGRMRKEPDVSPEPLLLGLPLGYAPPRREGR